MSLLDTVCLLTRAQIVDTLQHPWFHGDIDQATAEDRIRGFSTNGCFLVRFSSLPGLFTISQSMGKAIQHRRIEHEAGGPFVFENFEAGTLEALIIMLAAPLQLQNPCPGSRFDRIFTEEEPGGYVQSGMDVEMK